ncbi:hypothetical protein Q7P37_000891 [Cladosporium fusiforme]
MDAPSHRACAHCRSQKVRCLPDEANPNVCQRCARTGKQCVFTPLQKRKQRKRTDTRVAELEREMRAMRALLKEKSEGESPDSPSGSGTEMEPIAEDSVGEPDIGAPSTAPKPMRLAQGQSELLEAGRSVLQQSSQQPPQSGTAEEDASSAAGSRGDVVDRGVVPMDIARRLVEHYKRNLYPQYPQVYIPDSCTADELRATRPTLFLAVIAAASENEHPELAKTLDTEVLQEYATRSVVKSEKSVELVQSLLISAVWYVPPSKFGQLKYYEYIHMAATMAADIGITTRPSMLNRSRFAARNGMASSSLHPSEDYANPDLSMSIRGSQTNNEGTGSIDCRRAFLASYAICVGVSISLRRPAMMRVTTYTRECLDYIENSPQAAPGDQMFIAWVRLWMIAEEISGALHYDDPGDTASIFDTTTQLMVTAFQKRLSEWKSKVHDFVPSLQIMYYTIRLFLYELVLHIDHSPEDFKAPYQMGVIHPVLERDVPIKPAVEAISDLTLSSHQLINTFVDMGIDDVRCLPVFFFVRVSFAAFVLAKLCLSAHSKHSRLSGIIDRSTLEAEHHVDKLILFVQSLIGPKGQQVPALFLALLFKLRQWCSHPELIEQAEDIWPDDKAREQIAIHGPRIMETSSSAEPSPETINGSGFAAWNTPAAWSGEGPAAGPRSPDGGVSKQPAATAQGSRGQSITIPSTPHSDESWKVGFQDYPDFFAGPTTASVSPGTSTNNVGNAPTAPMAPWSTNDQMDLDSNMMSFLNDLDDLPQSNLTGLENWHMIPAGDYGLGTGWQGTGGADGQPPYN